jgi:hypothetical protein
LGNRHGGAIRYETDFNPHFDPLIFIVPVGLDGVDARVPSSKIELMAAASSRVNVKSTPTLRNVFRRFLVFIRCLYLANTVPLSFSSLLLCKNWHSATALSTDHDDR